MFYREYAGEDPGESVVHFHLAPASKAVLEAIQLHKTRKQFD